MASKEEYLQLTEKVSQLKEKRAILVSDEEKKAQERKDLIEELKNANIDPERPREEIERLEREIQDEYDQTKKLVDQFEAELNSAKKITPSNDVEAATADAQGLFEDISKGPEGSVDLS